MHLPARCARIVPTPLWCAHAARTACGALTAQTIQRQITSAAAPTSCVERASLNAVSLADLREAVELMNSGGGSMLDAASPHAARR